MNKLIIVVLYNKSVEDSETLLSLRSSFLGEGKIIVANNGPGHLYINNDFLSIFNVPIEIKEFINNKPLSYLYNDEIRVNPGYDCYIIFDDDTHIDIDYFNSIDSNEEYDIYLPRIVSNSDGLSYYPLLNEKPIEEVCSGVMKGDDKLSSIASGLVINKTLIEKFCSAGELLFDERFALYGVDVSLFKKIDKLKRNKFTFTYSVISKINHDLSRVGSEYSHFRELERMYDSVLSKIHYSSSFFDSSLFIFKKL